MRITGESVFWRVVSVLVARAEYLNSVLLLEEVRLPRWATCRVPSAVSGVHPRRRSGARAAGGPRLTSHSDHPLGGAAQAGRRVPRPPIPAQFATVAIWDSRRCPSVRVPSLGKSKALFPVMVNFSLARCTNIFKNSGPVFAAKSRELAKRRRAAGAVPRRPSRSSRSPPDRVTWPRAPSPGLKLSYPGQAGRRRCSNPVPGPVSGLTLHRRLTGRRRHSAPRRWVRVRR